MPGGQIPVDFYQTKFGRAGYNTYKDGTGDDLMLISSDLTFIAHQTSGLIPRLFAFPLNF